MPIFTLYNTSFTFATVSIFHQIFPHTLKWHQLGQFDLKMGEKSKNHASYWLQMLQYFCEGSKFPWNAQKTSYPIQPTAMKMWWGIKTLKILQRKNEKKGKLYKVIFAKSFYIFMDRILWQRPNGSCRQEEPCPIWMHPHVIPFKLTK